MTQYPAFIRTYVPLLVSALVGWLASIGLNVSDDAQTALAVGIGGVAAAVYYALIRWAEKHWPWVGALLGSTKTPDGYSTGTPVEDHAAPEEVDDDDLEDDVEDSGDDIKDDDTDEDEITDDVDETATTGRHVAE